MSPPRSSKPLTLNSGQDSQGVQVLHDPLMIKTVLYANSQLSAGINGCEQFEEDIKYICGKYDTEVVGSVVTSREVFDKAREASTIDGTVRTVTLFGRLAESV